MCGEEYVRTKFSQAVSPQFSSLRQSSCIASDQINFLPDKVHVVALVLLRLAHLASLSCTHREAPENGYWHVFDVTLDQTRVSIVSTVLAKKNP